MIDAQTVYLVGFVSEIMFAALLSLLAWRDQRTRGTTWFAATAIVQFFNAAMRERMHRNVSDAWTVSGNCLLVISYFLIYMGLRWFTLRKPLKSQLGPVLVSLALATVIALSVFNCTASRLAGRFASVAIMASVIPLLLRPRVPGMRHTARFVAGLLASLCTVYLFRNGIEWLIPSVVGGRIDLWARMVSLFLTNSLSFTFVGFFLAESQRRLHEETRMDVLTGLRNRRAMEEVALTEVQTAARQGIALSLLLIDADHFKKLNDTWGHAAGDRALRMLGEVLDQCTHRSGCVARVGGEEFAVLLPRTRMEDAAEAAECIRSSVEELALIEGGHRVPITVSIGVSALRGGERTWIDMLRRADKALYRAKDEGRNRVSSWREQDGERGSAHDSKLAKWRRAWITTTATAAKAAEVEASSVQA